ncbi:hypothetical protein B2G50_04025 [Leptospira interrogans serovar Canicola]|nr:hypothetical protein B2G50_04025 [Leptospira interrogans serovar Canicola]
MKLKTKYSITFLSYNLLTGAENAAPATLSSPKLFKIEFTLNQVRLKINESLKEYKTNHLYIL